MPYCATTPMRRGLPSRSARFLKSCSSVFPGCGLRSIARTVILRLPNGSRVWIGGLDDNDRVEKILGLEYASVFLNEASQIPYPTALIAFTRLAQVTRGIRQPAFADLNPAGEVYSTN